MLSNYDCLPPLEEGSRQSYLSNAQAETEALCVEQQRSPLDTDLALLRLPLCHLRCLDLGGPFLSQSPAVNQIAAQTLQHSAALESLILSNTAVTDTTLHAVAARFPWLGSLSVAACYNVKQAGIDAFHHLQSLDVSNCPAVSHVPPACCGTLRTLRAAGRCGIDDAALRAVCRIVTLNVSYNRRVTTVAPFAVTLRELNAAGNSGVNDAGLTDATCIVRLKVSYNTRVTTVAPFAATLRELQAAGSGISDAGLAEATGIVLLDVSLNRRVTTVSPFAATLRELDVSGSCGVSDAGLVDATGLVRLNISNNSLVTTVAPFAATLRELKEEGYSGVRMQGWQRRAS